MKRIFIFFIAILFVLFSFSTYALELVRQKNAATVIVFPIADINSKGLVTGVGTTDTEVDTWNDGANPDGFADMTEPTEIGVTGIYYIAMTTAEMNFDYIVIHVMASTSEADDQTLLIRTMIGDPVNAAVTDDGGAINVTGGAVDTVTTVTNQHTLDQIADAIWDEDIVGSHDTAETAGALLDSPGDWATAVGFSVHDAAAVWAVATRELTHLDEDVTTIDIDGTTLGTVGMVNALAADVITAASIQADAIGSSELATGAIGATEIDADAIGASELADSAVDEIWGEILAELGAGAPDATPSVRNAIMLLYMAIRNKTTTDTAETRICNDAGAVIMESDISDDGTTFTKGEYGAAD